MVTVTQFLGSVLKSLSKASDPLILGGILLVLITFIIYVVSKNRRFYKTINALLYWIISLATICIIAGLIPKIVRKSYLKGIVYYNCHPQGAVEVSLSGYQSLFTQPNGRFELEILPFEDDSIFLTFTFNKSFIGESTLSRNRLDKTTKYSFGDCSQDTTFYLSGFVRRINTGKGLSNAKVSIRNYPSLQTLTDELGHYKIEVTVKKSEKNNLFIFVTKNEKIYYSDFLPSNNIIITDI